MKTQASHLPGKKDMPVYWSIVTVFAAVFGQLCAKIINRLKCIRNRLSTVHMRVCVCVCVHDQKPAQLWPVYNQLASYRVRFPSSHFEHNEVYVGPPLYVLFISSACARSHARHAHGGRFVV